MFAKPEKPRYEMTMDYISQTPLHYLSVFLKYTMPKDFVWDQNLKKILECKGNTLLGFADRDLEANETVTAGSWAEGIAVPDFFDGSRLVIADIDKLMIENNTYYIQLPYEHREYSSGQILRIEHNPETHPNYDFLTPTEEYKKVRIIQGNPIKTKYFPNMALKTSLLKPWSRFTKDMSELSFHGPALTFVRSVMERDEVGVIYFPGWPRPARDWATRKRFSGWPGKRIIDKVLISGFYMAGVGRRGVEMGEYEWRYSFNITERILAHNFTRIQRQVYVYLKLFRKFYFSDPSAIPSYVLKTLFLWVCEKVHVSQFKSEELGRIMLYVFDEMIHALATRFLSNFYITSMNMFESIPPEHCKMLLKKVRYVRNNMIQCLVHIDSEINFINLNKGPLQKMSYIFEEAFDNVKKAPKNEDGFRNSVTAGLKGLLKYYLQSMLELESLDEKLSYEKQALTNVLVEMIREVLNDLHSFAYDCKDANTKRVDFEEMTVSLIFDVSKDSKIISRTLLLLELNSRQSYFHSAKQKLRSTLQRQQESRKGDQQKRDVLDEVIALVEAFTERDLSILDNEVIYQMKCLRDTSAVMDAPTKQGLCENCRQM